MPLTALPTRLEPRCHQEAICTGIHPPREATIESLGHGDTRRELVANLSQAVNELGSTGAQNTDPRAVGEHL